MKSSSMIAALAALALAVVGNLLGCRTNHLGHDTGQVYRAAIEAQRTGDDKVTPPPLSATDASQILHVHQTGKAKGAEKNGSSGLPASLTSSSGAMPGGAYPGATGNITLEAK